MLYQEQLCILDNVSSDERNCFITCNSQVRQLLWLLAHGIPDATTLFILVFLTYPEKPPKPRVYQHHRCSEVFAKEPTRSLFLLELWISFRLILTAIIILPCLLLCQGPTVSRNKNKSPGISLSDINRALLLILDGGINVLGALCGWKLPSCVRTPKVPFHISESHPWMMKRVQYVF